MPQRHRSIFTFENRDLNMDRRFFMTSTIGAFAALLATPVLAVSTSTAESMVGQASNELVSIVNSSSGNARKSKLRSFFGKYADINSVARSVLGAPYRSLSPSQKQAYTDAFTGYVVAKFSQQADIVKGMTATVESSRNGGSAGVLVKSVFRGKGVPKGVEWQVADVGGRPKFTDVRIEGWSIVGAEKQNVRNLYTSAGQNIDTLIAELKRRS